MTTSFAQLGVPDHICESLNRRGITEAFEIQAAAIPDALAGKDICGRAPTGSGKTLAFGIGLMANIKLNSKGFSSPRSKRPSALVLSPTRELADQISTELKSFGGKVKVGVVYGGVGYGPQVNGLRNGIDVLVACPGRLEDLIERGDVSLDSVSQVVIDEADRMADMGFMPGVKRILDQTMNDRQTLLFSATLDGEVGRLTKAYQNDPVYHEVGESTPDIKAATHLFWKVSTQNRIKHTAKVATRAWPTVVFCRTRHGADRLARQLGQEGVDAVAIHGGRSQRQRTRALDEFTNHSAQALVATDVAARGIHVEGVASVVHFDPAEDYKDYVHRSGRTARAGQGGLVVSMLKPEQKNVLKTLNKKLELNGALRDPDHDLLEEVIADIDRPTEKKQRPPEKSNGSGSSRRGGRGGNRGSQSARGRNGRNRSDDAKRSRPSSGSRKNAKSTSTTNRRTEHSNRSDDVSENSETPKRSSTSSSRSKSNGSNRWGKPGASERKRRSAGSDERRRKSEKEDSPSKRSGRKRPKKKSQGSASGGPRKASSARGPKKANRRGRPSGPSKRPSGSRTSKSGGPRRSTRVRSGKKS